MRWPASSLASWMSFSSRSSFSRLLLSARGPLALVLNRPVYDCVYLALVHRLGARMVAADGPSRMRCVD